MPNKFYKLARPDGWDFFTGRTINYRDAIGKIVKCPKFNKNGWLCSEAFIHASREPNQCFVGANKIPCSAYLVSGKPYAEDSNKCGFKQLKILEELQPDKLFKWRYSEACNPVHPFKIKPPKKITKTHLALLKEGASVKASVWASVKASVKDSVGDSVWHSVWYSVWDSVWDLVGYSIWYSIWYSARASVGAYIGYIFAPVVTKWKYIEHKKGEYPFQSAVDLWKLGLVLGYDGKLWQLHGGKDAETLWEGKS